MTSRSEDLGYTEIMGNKLIDYEKRFDANEKNNNLFDKKRSSVTATKALLVKENDVQLKKYFKTFRHKDMHWFACVIECCEHTESNRKSMETHVKKHLSEMSETIDISGESQTNGDNSAKTEKTCREECGRESKTQPNVTKSDESYDKKMSRNSSYHLSDSERKSEKTIGVSNRKLVEQKNVTTNGANEDTVRSYYDKYLHKNINWFVCNYGECDETETVEQNMISHVRQHLTKRQINEKKRMNKTYTKKVISKASKTLTSLPKISAQSTAKQTNFKSPYKGIYNAKNTRPYRQRIVVNGVYWHCCTYSGDCQYRTKSTHEIVKHIHHEHLGVRELRCSAPDCGKTFKYPQSLAEHQKNHLCGFRIDVKRYKYGTGVCSYHNIKKYYERVRLNEEKRQINQYSYKCLWSGCELRSPRTPAIQRHIHDRHVCPNRIKSN